MVILHSLIGSETEKRLHLWGVIRDHVIPGRDTQANHRPKEEKGESNDVLGVHKVALKCVDRYRCEKEQKSPQKVAMDVDRFIVQVQETLKALEVGIRFWSVFGKYEMVISLPRRKLVIFEEENPSWPSTSCCSIGLLHCQEAVKCLHRGCLRP